MDDPAMADFRAVGTIMGPAGLTAVFGMGTGGAPPAWSPESARGAVRPPGPALDASVSPGSGRTRSSVAGRGERVRACGGGDPAVLCPRDFGSSILDGRVEPSTPIAGSGIGRELPVGPGPRPPAPRPPGCGRCGGGSGWSSRSAVRTGRLRRSPAVHSRPIDLVVFQEPSGTNAPRKPGLGGGFALRCLQRLSGPDLATRRCPERDSRHTRGRSSPILSY